MSDLAELEALAGALLRDVAPAARRTLLRQMAKDLQRSQRERIARQVAPDGTPFPARRGKAVAPADSRFRKRGTIRRGAMFRRLRLARNLKSGATDTEAWVGFLGRAARIARVHQEGGVDRPSSGQAPVRYARRELIGVSQGDEARLLDLLLSAIHP